MHSNKSQFGFTLIELSIVLIISGILTVAAIEAYTIYDAKRKLELTQSQITDIDQYLNDFPNMIDPTTADPVTGLGGTVYGRLPCPDSNGDGVENCAMSTVAGRQPDGSAGGPAIMIGNLPYITLGAAIDYASDPYGSPIIYGITRNSTIPGNYGVSVGGIQITDHNGNISNTIQYIVISTGQAGCSGGADAENCDEDSDFIAAFHTDVGSNYYDDRVSYHAQVPTLVNTDEPVSCEQSESLTTFADSCPDGWDEEVGFYGDPAPTYAGTSLYGDESYNGYDNRGSVHIYKSKNGEKHYYNVDPDSGDYYMTSFPTDNTALAPQSGQRKILCNKNPSGNTKTKCFTKQVTTQASGSGDGGTLSMSQLEDRCPDGWNIVDVEHKNSFLSGDEASWTTNDYTVTCGQ